MGRCAGVLFRLLLRLLNGVCEFGVKDSLVKEELSLVLRPSDLLLALPKSKQKARHPDAVF